MPDSEQHSSHASHPSSSPRKKRRYDDDRVENNLEEYDDRPVTPPLPPRGLPSSLLIGVIAGALGVIINIAITFLNAPIYGAVAQEGSQVTGNTYIVFGLGCLNFFLVLLACFFAGFFVGKVAVQRRLGFYAGALAGAITYIASFLVNYLPNYPGKLATSTPVNAGAVSAGLATSLVFLLVWAAIGGLIGLWGAWMVTRKHPYYAG